jgi:hypothetical protein
MTPSFDRTDKRLTVRLHRIARMELDALQNFGFSLLVAAPLVLLALDGAWFAVGLGYAVAYVVMMLVPTALYVLMGFDALRVIARKQAAFVPFLMAMGRNTATAEVVEKKTPRAIKVFTKVGLAANPFSSLTRELWIVAFRSNPAGRKEVQDAAAKIAKELKTNGGMTSQLVAAEIRAVPRHTNEYELVLC